MLAGVRSRWNGSLLQWSGVSVVGGVSTMAVWRHRKISKKRAELLKDSTRILQEINELVAQEAKGTDEVLKKKKWEKDTTHTLKVLWEDRFARFKEKVTELQGYLKALPEAAGSIYAVHNHYSYMTTEMAKYTPYDTFIATAHNVGLLLEHANTVGICAVSRTINMLLHRMDQMDANVVGPVCSHLESVKSIECPQSIKDASDSFAFCIGKVYEERDRIAQKYGDAEPGMPLIEKSNFFLDGFRMVVRKLRLNTLSSSQVENEKYRLAFEALFKDEQNALNTEKDMMAAMDYAATLRRLLSFDGTDRKLSSDPLAMAIASDHGVQLAVAQLDLWRNATATFLLQEQAKSVLNSYYVLLSESLTAINE